ncbi:hypothetical protein KOM00_07320 [Geomonas sp. Red69]|uniref:hypothetical protein n=1 Tax=Geomonas diazotrophica TaxID=2843197 RepID=UPI001C117EE5|nr:hypothetical protein [Geomonas diazotrophica]MBU5636545.1 hypothetical protein [Geomonas diazotrophica]
MRRWIKRIAISLGLLFFLSSLGLSYWLVLGGGRYEFYLPFAANRAMKHKDFISAEFYAEEMFKSAAKSPCGYNYGNAVHDANIVLGLIAVENGNINEAKSYLLKAGKTPGSPQLNTFGPNMVLANKLLKRGERSTVIEYLNLCKMFWKMDDGKLSRWKAEIQKGQSPVLARD